jgi:hypothetical protein
VRLVQYAAGASERGLSTKALRAVPSEEIMTATRADDKPKGVVPLRDGIFRIPKSPDEKPAVIANRCPRCGEHFFPKRAICLACGQVGLEEVHLTGPGKIWTFTIARQTPPGSLIEAPYVIAQVQLPEKVIVGSVLSDCDVEAVRVGMAVELALEKVKQDEEGNDVVALKFRLTQ